MRLLTHQFYLLAISLIFVNLSPPVYGAETEPTTPVFIAGFAQVEITPPVGWRMAGDYTEHISTGIHDPLYVKTAVWKQGENQGVLLICDVCSVSRVVTDPLRKSISQATDIPETNIAVTATHTHAGPEYYGIIRDTLHQKALQERGNDPHESINYPLWLVDRGVEAVQQAQAGMKPVRLDVGKTQLSGIAFNRRYHMKDGSVQFNPGKLNPDIVRPAGPVDEEVPILLFRNAANGGPIGSLTVFAMHTATFGTGEFSADYPGYLQNHLRDKLGPDFISLFGEGTAGDVNHFKAMRKEPDAVTAEIGAALAANILKAFPDLLPISKPTFAVRSTRIPVPLQEITEEQIARARDIITYKLTPTPAFLVMVDAWKVLNTQMLRERDGANLMMEVQAFVFGDDTAVVTLPHEVFVELGMAIKKQSPYKNTFVISLANDLDFYVPTRKAFAEGSYEVTTSSIRPGGGELLVDGAVKLLNEIKNQ